MSVIPIWIDPLPVGRHLHRFLSCFKIGQPHVPRSSREGSYRLTNSEAFRKLLSEMPIRSELPLVHFLKLVDLASALESESNSRIYGLRRLSHPYPNDGAGMAHLSHFDPIAEKNGFPPLRLFEV